MGFVTMVRLARNMPRKLTNATLYSSSILGDVDLMMKPQAHPYQLPAPTISTAEYFSMVKRMAELEEKVIVLSNKPAVMPPEKEEMLNAALSRVDALEQQLSATKKVSISLSLSLSSMWWFGRKMVRVQRDSTLSFDKRELLLANDGCVGIQKKMLAWDSNSWSHHHSAEPINNVREELV